MSQNSKIIKIRNCNCIKDADISIVENSLNIKYGTNGTGKSTIGNAISLVAKNELDKLITNLCPYTANTTNSEEMPNVPEMPFTKVKVFNDEYVNGYLFQGNGFFDDPFQVFLNSDVTNQLMEKISELLANLQSVFQESENIHMLRDFLPSYFEATKYKNGSIPKTGGVGEFIKGNGAGFENYAELDEYKPFYEGRSMKDVSSWAKWRRDGIDRMNGDNCPFCTHKMDEKIDSQNQIIKKVFKNSALSTASAVLEYIKKAVEHGYILAESVTALESYIGNKNKADELLSELNQLAIETEYIFNKLEKINKFKPMNVTHDQLEEIENNLEDMKIDARQISKFYSTDLMVQLVNSIAEKIEELKSNTRKLKNLFTAHERKLKELIESRKEDINQFLALAGFPYMFELRPDGEKKAVTYLVPVNSDNKQVFQPAEHLSWGEKNAFALVMFMFEANSEDVDLIVLDDPISSFDTNKKFAVVRRLFDNQKESFRDKTVLMLTHDLQPIIDYVHGGFFKRFGLTTPVNAAWIQNENGSIHEKNIEQDDLKNIVELTKGIAENNAYPMAVRVVNLRKYVELTKTDFTGLPIYEVLSNLIHGREQALDKNGNNLDVTIFNDGCTDLKRYFENKEYEDVLAELTDNKLQDLVDNGDNYSKVIAFRLLFERNEELFKRLRKLYPASYKFINETNHIENDYVFQLDPLKYYGIPEYYLNELKSCIQNGI